MQCTSCKKEIKEGSSKCPHCGVLVAENDSQRNVKEVKSLPTGRQVKSEQSWWKYSVFSDKSISRLDQILFFVYIGFAFYIPISALLSLVIIHVIRKDALNAVYKKTATVVIVFMAIFSILANVIRHFHK